MVEGIQSEIERIEEYARCENVPIMMKDGISFLLQFIKEKKIKRILEIGTAIGYSAIRMALVDSDIEIVTIERDEKRYLEAIRNVKKLGLEEKITLIFQDALEVHVRGSFDLIFIDAAKGQNIRFFERFQPHLGVGGYVITDNMDFHGMVDVPEDTITSKNVLGLVRKIKKYKAYLENRSDYVTTFYSVGDGLSVSRKIC